MKIITTHRNPDFDGFASCIAAKKLYEGYTIVISGRPSQNLLEYLRIYGDRFKYITEKELEEDIEKIVLVDTSSFRRVGEKIRKFLNNVDVIIYDHHPETENEGINGVRKIEKLGATITLMTELLIERGLEIDPIEATLFMIALYEDTGNLLYSSTTSRDIEVAKILLEKGANLEEVANFVKTDLTLDQKKIAEDLMNNTTDFEVNGVKISIAMTETEKFVGGLNVVVSKLWSLGGYETLICIIRHGKKVHIIGRTSSPDVDLGEVMRELGGGGHKKAASCTIEETDMKKILERLLETLKKHIKPVLRAKDIMSSPVKVALSQMKIKEVNKIMERTGHNGMPIIEGNRLVGIVTKKAVDKAINHGLGDRPVKSIMTSKLVTVNPDTPVTKIRELMIEHNIGRIPVLENGILVGIVTRSDILKAVFGEPVKRYVKPIYRKDGKIFFDVTKEMTERIPPRVLNLLRLFGKFGDEISMPVYVVGGFVRDLLLNIPNLDIDLVVEGNAMDFAKYSAKFLEAKVVKYDKFMTASLFFKDGFRVDVATARTEYYESPAKLPQVEMSTIKKDLYRRDFTINALAIKLNPADFGTLLDFFGGVKDLEEGIIRALHTLSFIDDPTRIIRAIRFEQRFGFKIEEVTEKILREAVREGLLEKTTGQRIRQEIEKILEEKDPLKAIRRMAEFDIIKHVFPKTYYTSVLDEKLEKLFKFLKWAENFFEKLNKFYSILHVMLEYYDMETLHFVRKRYGLPKKMIDEIKRVEKIAPVIAEMIENRLKFSDIYKVVKDISPEGFCHISSYLSPEAQEYLKEFLKKLRETKLKKVDGDFLIKLGMKPGKIIGEILDELYSRKLDEELLDEEEVAKLLVKEYLKKEEKEHDKKDRSHRDSCEECSGEIKTLRKATESESNKS